MQGQVYRRGDGRSSPHEHGQQQKKSVHPRAIGAASFSIEGDEEKTIDMALNQAGRTLIRSVRRSVSASL
jgi:hypothetical protein